MNRQRLAVTVASADVATVEAWLTLAGAEMLVLRDAADDPVLEPAPGTAPLWPNVTVEAVFGADANLAPLHALLATRFPGAPLAAARLPHSAAHVSLEQTVKARPIGTRLWLAPTEDVDAPRERAVVRLNMGLAFGTGEHPTTALCLDWLERNIESGMELVDYGCGSGVLALAALALGADHAFAVDNDEQALIATRANAAVNRVADRLFIGAPEMLPDVAVDVLAANILAGPLTELAATFARHVRVGGSLILSGVLERQAADVAAAYAPHFGALEATARDGWMRLVGRRILS